MGVLHGRDLLTAKYTTAIISDSEDRVHFVPLKHTLGDYFVVDMDKKIFAFTLKGARILTYRETGAKSFRIILYDTSNFRSLNPQTKNLEQVLQANALPRMNMMLFNILKILGRKEKDRFEVHKIENLVQELNDKGKDYPEEVKNITNFLESLEIKEIVTPVRKLTEFIEDDLIATSPSFLGEMVPRYQRLDVEHKKITNVPIGPKIAWMKYIMVFMIVGMVGFMIYYGYEQGWFDTFLDLGSSFEGISFPSPTTPFAQSGPQAKDSAYYQANYSPEELRAAIDSGEVNEDELPTDIKEMVKGVEAANLDD